MNHCPNVEMKFQVEVVSLLEIKQFVQVFPAARVYQTQTFTLLFACGSLN